MKIEEIEVIPVSIPLKKPAQSVHGPIASQPSVVIRIWTQSREYGIGSVEPLPFYDLESQEEVVRTVSDRFVPLIIGEDPFRIRMVLEIMDTEIGGHPGSKALVEMALFDLLGRHLGVPVHALLGGRVRETISLNGWIGTVAPEQAGREALQWLERGFESLKIKIDSRVSVSRERVQAVRSAVGKKMQIRVDANESLDMEAAMETARLLQDLDVFYLEQPFARGSLQDFVALSKSCSMRLMADESVEDVGALVKILKLKAAHLVKVKVQKMGGILRTSQAIQVAESFGMPVVLGHGFGTSLNTLAELHLAASTRAVLDGCEAVGPIKMADDVVTERLFMDRGFVEVPTKPGLGAELDENKLKVYRVK